MAALQEFVIEIATSVSPSVLVASYACLVAVNTVFGAGLLGAPTNGKLSASYPTHITPSGATFAIWGPIFLLQAGGTTLMAGGGAPAQMAAVAGPWVLAWAAECAWQFAFATVPVPAGDTSQQTGRKLVSLVPALALISSAHYFMRSSAVHAAAASSSNLLGSVLIDFPTGLNAGWLAAASGISATLVMQHLPVLRHATTQAAGGVLVGAVTAYGALTTLALAGSPGAALGYAAATAWACRGIASESAENPRVVKQVAGVCKWVALAAGAAALAKHALQF